MCEVDAHKGVHQAVQVCCMLWSMGDSKSTQSLQHYEQSQQMASYAALSEQGPRVMCSKRHWD